MDCRRSPLLGDAKQEDAMSDELDDDALSDDEQALLEEMPELTDVGGHTRRTFIGTTIAGSLGLFALDLLAQQEALAALAPAPDAVMVAGAAGENIIKVALKVNGATRSEE